MKVLLRIVGVLVVIVVGFLLFGFLAPREIRVERSTVVEAPPEAVYPLVADLKRWPDWQAWNEEMDPTVIYAFSEPAVGEGASYEWKGDKLSTGKVAITGVEPNRSVAYTVAFAGSGPNPGTMTFEEVRKAGHTHVVWTFHCDMGFNPIGRYFGLFLAPMLKGDFDEGLANLKRLAETEQLATASKSAPKAESDEGASDAGAAEGGAPESRDAAEETPAETPDDETPDDANADGESANETPPVEEASPDEETPPAAASESLTPATEGADASAGSSSTEPANSP